MCCKQHGPRIIASHTTGGNDGIFIVIDEADTDISLHINIVIKSAFRRLLSGLSISTYVMVAQLLPNLGSSGIYGDWMPLLGHPRPRGTGSAALTPVDGVLDGLPWPSNWLMRATRLSQQCASMVLDFLS
ncbi:hypothetical protein EmuJ_000395900 [Echinococcus multilocularis]|uniref:Uncharacterized protein n=1 Tax=Echinococcus multilocularis TaxID=6211 RepID=A0A068XWN6_ECHMU|nr:hypothetical protein EmuJ_000395900 [Echinococcus multilocularis]